MNALAEWALIPTQNSTRLPMSAVCASVKTPHSFLKMEGFIVLCPMMHDNNSALSFAQIPPSIVMNAAKDTMNTAHQNNMLSPALLEFTTRATLR